MEEVYYVGFIQRTGPGCYYVHLASTEDDAEDRSWAFPTAKKCKEWADEVAGVKVYWSKKADGRYKGAATKILTAPVS